MLKSILVGLLLTIATIGIHGIGTVGWLSYLQRRVATVDPVRRRRLIWQLQIISMTACTLLLLHIVEVSVWATVYLWLVNSELLTNLEEALYFSTVTFTSLGYGDVVLQPPWRLLSAIQAITGILVFGWSTALVFAVVQRIWFANERRIDSK